MAAPRPLAALLLLFAMALPLHAATRGEEMGAFVELRDPKTAPALHDLGLGWVRIMYHWTWLEPSEGKMIWFEFDKWIKRAREQHLKVLIVAQGSPAWANGGKGPYDSPSGLNRPPLPEFTPQFAHYTAELVRHGADAIEIWNEPNGGFWRPKPDPAAWARLVVAAYDAVKAVDPKIPVITGGVCPVDNGSKNPNSPAGFLEAALTAVPELATHCDGIGHHPYVFANNAALKDPLTAPYQWNAVLQTTTLHELMAKHGAGEKPFWFTEYGVPTGGPFGAVTPDESGVVYQHYYDAFDRLAASGVKLGPSFFWTLNDMPNYQKANSLEGWEGIYDTSGNPKASVEVIRKRAASDQP